MHACHFRTITEYFRADICPLKFSSYCLAQHVLGACAISDWVWTEHLFNNCGFFAVQICLIFSIGSEQGKYYHAMTFWNFSTLWFVSLNTGQYQPQSFSGLCLNCPIHILGGVGHCFAWHVWVNLGFYFSFKIEVLVHSGLCVQCDFWHITAYLPLPELKYYYEKWKTNYTFSYWR